MYCSDCNEVDRDCERLSAAELASEGRNQSDDELKLLTEKWSR